MIIMIGFIFSITNLYSQNWTYKTPDYDLMKTQINDKSSSFFYPKLMERLINNDMTLTIEEFRYLYYGYIFQPKYDPYWKSPYQDKLDAFYSKSNLEKSDYDEFIKLASLSIKEFPFDLRQMNSLAYIYHLKGEEENSKKVSYIFQGILQAIMSSGDGQTCATGLHVISTSHEYVILNMLQFKVLGQSLTSDFCDCMKVKEDQREEVNIYFSIKRLWDANIEKMKNK